VIAKALIGLLALTIAGFGTAYAASLTVSSHHVWAGSQGVARGTCTLTGNGQSVDTYVDEANPSSSFGSAPTMSVEPDSGARRYVLIRFDLSSCGIPSSGGADSATLKLVMTATPGFSRTLAVLPIGASWSGSTTWNSMPGFAASPTTTFATGTSKTTLSIPVTADVDAWIRGASSNDGWLIADYGAPVANDTTTFSSAKAGSNKPQLVIAYEK